jgi:hypothetical protein
MANDHVANKMSSILALKSNRIVGSSPTDLSTLTAQVSSHEARLDIAEADIADLYTGLTQSVVVVTQVTPSVVTATLNFTDGRLTSIT